MDVKDLPAASRSELEDVAEVLFAFVSRWTRKYDFLTGQALYNRIKAEELERYQPLPADLQLRLKEYGRREALFNGWARPVWNVVSPFLALAELVAVMLGGKMVDGVFKPTAPDSATPPPDEEVARAPGGYHYESKR